MTSLALIVLLTSMVTRSTGVLPNEEAAVMRAAETSGEGLDGVTESTTLTLENVTFVDGVNETIISGDGAALNDSVNDDVGIDNATLVDATIGNDTLDLPVTNPSNDSTPEANETAPVTPFPTPTPPRIYVDPREFETHPSGVNVSDCLDRGDVACSSLPVHCLNCSYDYACAYGEQMNVECVPMPKVACRGDQILTLPMTCRYCFQTNQSEHVCNLKNGPDANMPRCHVKKAPSSQSRFRSNCTVKSHVLCLGRRSFQKMLPCNWTSGYRWTTALFLSVFLGGFGADRFYLGQWREGIGKLFSFGGLGVWTVIDVILIAIGYIGPEDGSLFIY